MIPLHGGTDGIVFQGLENIVVEGAGAAESGEGIVGVEGRTMRAVVRQFVVTLGGGENLLLGERNVGRSHDIVMGANQFGGLAEETKRLQKLPATLGMRTAGFRLQA